MSYTESIALTSTSMSSMGVPSLTSTTHCRWTSMIAPPSSSATSERPNPRSPLSKASPHHRRSMSLNLTALNNRNRQSAPWSAAAAFPPPLPFAVYPRSPSRSRSRSRSCLMLSKINTSLRSPDRPSRRPHGPRSACSPSVSSAKSATRTHYHDIWKTKAGRSIRTSPPQISLPYDADTEQDPLFNILPDQFTSDVPRRYCLKLIDVDPLSSDEDSPFDSLFSFTATPVESPSYVSTTFSPRQTRPAPLSLHSHSLSQQSFFSPMSPEFAEVVMRPFGGADKVDRWIQGGLEPLMTPMIVDQDTDEQLRDDVGQSDWREVIDRFLQHAEGDMDDHDLRYPPTPSGNERELSGPR